MIQIGDTLVSLDLIERYFLCDLSRCKGACCVEGDSGAPLEEGEPEILQRILPAVWNDLSPQRQETIHRQGVSYTDVERDTVTSLVNGEECVFTCRDSSGICRCAIEKACREGRTDFCKPVSCHLYPVRIRHYAGFTAVNFHRWDICKAAETRGREEHILAYQFLKEPLTRKFGTAWYDELQLFAEEWRKRK